MFGTSMHPITFSILIFQLVALFALLLFYLARPNDTSRLRFLALVLLYITYNFISGLLPSQKVSIPMIAQYTLCFSAGCAASVYFVQYLYQEFDIYPYRSGMFSVKTLLWTLIGSYIALFVIPFLLLGNVQGARLLFLVVPVLLSLAFLIRIGYALWTAYQKENDEASIYYKLFMLSCYLGFFTLCLFPFVLAFANIQYVKAAVLNLGFLIMIATYFINFLAQAKQEALLLQKLQAKEQVSEIQIANALQDEILGKLEAFENNQEYLKGKVTITTLAREFGTNGRYLSFLVNTHKKKNFTSYVNDLRIDYAIDRLQKEEHFRNQLTIKAMAHELGFSSPETLTMAFFKSQNIKLSKYLKQIRK